MMMNQGESTDSIASLEKHQINYSQQVHTSYFSPNCAAASWNTQAENHSLRENGVLSTSGFNHDPQVEPTLKIAQDGSNVTFIVSASSSVPANGIQGYSGYAAYPNTDPYGYSSACYADYYNQYQQQPSQYQRHPSQYQQEPTQYQQQPSQYQQEPTQYQQQPSQYQQEPTQYQQQPSHYQQQHCQYVQQPSQCQQHPGQYQQQSDRSYPHQVGAYQNTGAPYQPLSSFQNAGSYAGPASYPSTYYDPGDYQTSGSYTSGSYGAQPNLLHGEQYGTYSSHQYQNYSQDSSSAYSSTSAVATSQYQQHCKQWEDYYNQTQTEVSCAPGTEKLSVSAASSVSSSVPSGIIAHTTSINQMPTAYTPVWRPESSSSEMTFMQPIGVSASTPDWKQGASAFQNGLPNSVQPHAQKSPEVISAYESSENQQNPTVSHGSTPLYPAPYEVSQSHQSSVETVLQPFEPRDSLNASKLQILTNPRIASNLPLSVLKNEKDSSVTSRAAKPAYVGVPMPMTDEKVISHEEADTMLKPGMFPKSLRGYVERALARCKSDTHKTACQAIMKELITKATVDGTLYTKDWDIEPLFPMPNTDTVDKDGTLFPILTSAMPKSRSPSRRAKSRWGPIPEEKTVHKSADISAATAVHGGWFEKQVSGEKFENNCNFGSKFSFAYQRSFSKNVTRPAKRQRLDEDLNAAADVGETSSDSDKEQSLTKYDSAATALADSPEEKKRRENRSKRFDKGHGSRTDINNYRAKDVGTGNLYARRASALVLSRTFEESSGRAVEDIDWDALTVKGTCQEIEKRYLRLTSAPDPAAVRPEEVLVEALLMVQNSQKNYLYKCDQLKSIRQDLTVQHIHNELTVKVYETHARLAIEVGDLAEYNQCQSQLTTLYAEGITGCHMEFAAYNLLCVLMHSNNNRDLLSAMSRLSGNAKKDKAVKHALSVRSAVTSGNYVMFFRLYGTAPNLNTLLMDLYVEKMRYTAVKCIARSYRPTVPVSYLSQILGFNNAILSSEARNEKELDGVEECIEWLKAHGGCVISDSSGESLLDTKASALTLYMPDREDAVSHGDATLAVNDFLTRSLA